MKKNLIGLLILALLAGAAYYVHQQRGKGTLKPALHDFAVKDTASVTKVILADKAGKTVTLTRKSVTEWQVNGTFKARKDLMDVLLKTISRVEMKSPVAEAAHNNVVRRLAGHSTKAEIYAGDELVKSYFVGDATNDHMGTHMLLEGSGKAFVCHIPGFHGYLSGRYVADVLEWRDTEVFANRIPQIAEVVVDYNEYPDKSFRISRSSDGKISLETLNPEPKAVVGYDTVEVMRYLLNYNNIRFERAQRYDKERVDSIVNSPWLYSIRLTEPGGRVRSVTTHRILADPDDTDSEGDPLEWDPDQMHAVLNGNENEVVLVQYFSFDRLTVAPEYFLRNHQDGQPK